MVPFHSRISAFGTLSWSNDPILASVERFEPGRYLLEFRSDVADSALLVAPLASFEDGQPLLATARFRSPRQLEIRVFDAFNPSALKNAELSCQRMGPPRLGNLAPSAA
jgi:hypothetical protein